MTLTPRDDYAAADDLLVRRSARPLTASEGSLLDQFERDLDLIAAGIDPA